MLKKLIAAFAVSFAATFVTKKIILKMLAS